MKRLVFVIELLLALAAGTPALAQQADAPPRRSLALRAAAAQAAGLHVAAKVAKMDGVTTHSKEPP